MTAKKTILGVVFLSLLAVFSSPAISIISDDVRHTINCYSSVPATLGQFSLRLYLGSLDTCVKSLQEAYDAQQEQIAQLRKELKDWNDLHTKTIDLLYSEIDLLKLKN
jgi:hypothetical protein